MSSKAGVSANIRCLATPDQLLSERSLFYVLQYAFRFSSSEEPVLHVPTEPGITLELLHGASGYVFRMESHVSLRRRASYDWDGLIELVGGEEALKARIADLKAARLEGASEVLEMADRYISGWRPGRD